jgi:hypothetical protein
MGVDKEILRALDSNNTQAEEAGHKGYYKFKVFWHPIYWF